MDEEDGKPEEKFDFTGEGESMGYISMDQAQVLAMETARDNPNDYGQTFQNNAMAFGVAAAEETADHYVVTLSFRPQGNFSGAPGQEQFFISKEGLVAHRQVLELPRSSAGRGIFKVPIAIGLVVVLAAAAIGVVLASQSGGGEDDVGIPVLVPTATPASAPVPAVIAPTNTPVPTATTMPAVTPTMPPPTATATPAPAPQPTSTLSPTPTARVIVVTATPAPTPTARVIVVTATPAPTPTRPPIPTPTMTPRPTATRVPFDGKYTLLVEESGVSLSGRVVSFQVAGLEADQTADWQPGGASNLDLTASAGRSFSSPEEPGGRAGPKASPGGVLGSPTSQAALPHVFTGLSVSMVGWFRKAPLSPPGSTG